MTRKGEGEREERRGRVENAKKPDEERRQKRREERRERRGKRGRVMGAMVLVFMSAMHQRGLPFIRKNNA